MVVDAEFRNAVKGIMDLHPNWGYVKVGRAVGSTCWRARRCMEGIRGGRIMNPKRKPHTHICSICGKDRFPMYKHIQKSHPEYKLIYRNDKSGHSGLWCGYCNKKIQDYSNIILHNQECLTKKHTKPTNHTQTDHNKPKMVSESTPIINDEGNFKLFDQLFAKIKRLEDKNAVLVERLHSENGNSQKLASYVAEAQRLLAKKE